MTYSLSSKKDIYQYDWLGKFSVMKSFRGYDYRLHFRVLSNFYSLPSTDGYFNDQVKISQQISYQLNTNWNIELNNNYNKFHNQQVNLNIDQLRNLGLVRFKNQNLSFKGILGNSYKNKYSISQNAVTYGFSGSLKQNYPENRIQISADYLQENFSYNRDRKLKVGLGYFTQFNKWTSDSVSFSYSSTNYADYFTQNLDLEKVNIKEWNLDNFLIFYRNANSRLSYLTRIKKRDFYQSRFNSEGFRKEIEIYSILQYQFSEKKWQGKLDLKSYLLNNDFDQNFLDNEHLVFEYNGQFQYNFNTSHSLEFLSRYAKLEYNTPDSTINFDDRDELTGLIQIQYHFKPNRFLHYSLFLKGRYFYQKYIFRERSALNNKEVILNLGFSTLIKGRNFRNFIRSGIRSYYLIHDYAENLPNLNDIVNRRLSLEDTLTVIFDPRNSLTLYARYEKEEIGSLDWSGFAYSLERENSRNQFMVYFSHDIIRRFTITPGFSVIGRKDFYIPGTLRVIRDYKSKSYWIRLQYQLHSNRFLFFQLQKFIIDDQNYSAKSYILGNANIVWRF